MNIITAEEARSYTKSNEAQELITLNKAIKSIAIAGKNKLSLSTGLTSQAQREQDKIYPNFSGCLSEYTISTLKELGYVIKTDSSYQGSFVDISW